MSLLVQKKQGYDNRSYQMYLDQVYKNKAENTTRQFVTQMKFFSQFCFETYSDWSLHHMHLAGAETIIKELMHQTKEEDRIATTIDVLQEFINWRSQTLSPASLQSMFWHITNYLYWRGIRIDKRDINSLHFPKIAKKKPYSMTMEEIVRFVAASNHERQALYLAQVSSGMRIGETMQVIKKDMRLYKDHFFVTVRAETTKTFEEREAILSVEATQAILQRWESIGSDELVYISTTKWRRSLSETIHFIRLRQRLGIGTPDFHPTLHRFRGFFYKMATKTADSDYAHRMLGHGGYLPNYGELTDDEKLQSYAKVEPELTVQDYYKNKLRDTTMEDRVKELELKLQASSNLPDAI